MDTETSTQDECKKERTVCFADDDPETLAKLQEESVRKRTDELDKLRELGNVSRKLTDVEELEAQNAIWAAEAAGQECIPCPGKRASNKSSTAANASNEDVEDAPSTNADEPKGRSSIGDLLVGPNRVKSNGHDERDRVASGVGANMQQDSRQSFASEPSSNLFSYWLTPKDSESSRKMSPQASRKSPRGSMQEARESRKEAKIASMESRVHRKLEETDAKVDQTKEDIEVLRKSLAEVKELTSRHREIEACGETMQDKSHKLHQRVSNPPRKSHGVSTMITHHRETLACIKEDPRLAEHLMRTQNKKKTLDAVGF